MFGDTLEHTAATDVEAEQKQTQVLEIRQSLHAHIELARLSQILADDLCVCAALEHRERGSVRIDASAGTERQIGRRVAEVHHRCRDAERDREKNDQESRRDDNRTIGPACGPEQHEAKNCIHREDVAVPQQDHVNDAERQQYREAAAVDRDKRYTALPGTKQLNGEAQSEQKRQGGDRLADHENPNRVVRQGVQRKFLQMLTIGGETEDESAEPPHVRDNDAEQRKSAQHVERKDALLCADGFKGTSGYPA
jgi:hypothetical protein